MKNQTKSINNKAMGSDIANQKHLSAISVLGVLS